MATADPVRASIDNLGQLWERLGRVPLERIRLQPPPGQATAEDVLHCKARYGTLCELIDGTLVEKAMGWYESWLASILIRHLHEYRADHNLGILLGEAGMVHVEPQVRMGDVAFVAWEHVPEDMAQAPGILDVVPALNVEILSPSNTVAEMERKRREYFFGGCRLVWEVDPRKRTVRVYTAPDKSKLLREKHTLDGGDVLPGFKLSVAEWFRAAEKPPQPGAK